MMRHILATIGLAITLLTINYLYQVDKEIGTADRINKVIEASKKMVEMAKKNAQPVQQKIETPPEEDETKIEQEKLKALKEKAGNIGGFKVSALYKTKCSSCHGYNAEGGIGPKLIGRKYEYISKNLSDFKSGARKNYVMYGLLQNITDEDLDKLAKEIAEFEKRAKELSK